MLSTWSNQVEEVIKHYPKLKRKVLDGVEMIAGDIDVQDSDGNILQTYSIAILPPPDAFSFPIVRETRKVIPRCADRHMYSDGRCCLTTPLKEQLTCIKGINILFFIKQYVLSFFANQFYFSIYEEFAGEEYSHGVPGIFESYQEILGKYSYWNIVFLILSVINNSKIRGTQKCPCKSNKLFKECHKNAFKLLSKIDRNILICDIEKIIFFYKI